MHGAGRGNRRHRIFTNRQPVEQIFNSYQSAYATATNDQPYHKSAEANR